jgi:DNA-binding HxlR family transcriptional regulator
MADGTDRKTRVLSGDEDFFSDLSEYLEALSSSSRLKILQSIRKRPKDIRELSSEIQTSYENTKKHLDKLVAIGVVKKSPGLSRPTSKGVHPVWEYSLIPGAIDSVIRNLGVFSTLPAFNPGLAARLAGVRATVAREVAGHGAIIVVMGGTDDGRVFMVPETGARIGRADPDAGAAPAAGDVVLSEDYAAVTRVGRPHARITCVRGTWFIEDTGSTGGTSVNGHALAPHTKMALADGCSIALSQGVRGAVLSVMIPPEQGRQE